MNKEIKRLTKEFDEVLKPITPKVLESILPESVEETKDWTKPDENGDVDVPDYLMPLLNKLGFQLRFHTISGEGEAITLVRMTSIAEKFFKVHHFAEVETKYNTLIEGLNDEINAYEVEVEKLTRELTDEAYNGQQLLEQRNKLRDLLSKVLNFTASMDEWDEIEKQIRKEIGI